MKGKLRVGVNVEVSITPVLSAPGWATDPKIGHARDQFLNMIMDKVVFYARRNVQPGMGPGPHPHHSKHMDTGTLMRAITWNKTKNSWGRTVFVAPSEVNPINNVPAWVYGKALELGWHAGKAGKFYRYPWLAPAFEKVAQNVPQYMRTHFWAPLEFAFRTSHSYRTTVYSTEQARGRIWAVYK